MAVPYPRSFNSGRQSEQLYNDDLHKVYESTRHIAEVPQDPSKKPQGKLSGSLYVNQFNNTLEAYHRDTDEWRMLFKEKFQLVDEIMNILPSTDPVRGQLWLYNGVLCYWDGSAWKPAKALAQDSSEFDLSLFEDFLMMSPLNKKGNTIIEDDDIEAFKKARYEFFLNKLDPKSGSEFNGDGTEWELGKQVDYGDIPVPEFHVKGLLQYLLPNIKVDRIFADELLDTNYEIVSPVAIQYEKDFVKDRRISCLHVNPNKLTKITKTLYKIDRVNPHIPHNTHYTEFYGFQVGNPLGDFLKPEAEADDGGYFTDDNEKGIILSYDQAHHYDYVLAVTFEFSWLKATGTMRYLDSSEESTSSFFIQNFLGPNSIFVDGYEIGDDAFYEDNLSKTVTIKENVNGRDINAFHTIRREFGFVRHLNIKNQAVIDTVQEYRRPLIFMNGEAMNASLGDVYAINRDGIDTPDRVADRRLSHFEVVNGKMNMGWTVVELCDREIDGEGTDDVHHDYDMLESEGIVPAPADDGKCYIHYTTDDIDIVQTTDGHLRAGHMVLFVEGLLVDRRDIDVDVQNKTITAPGLAQGQDYILLKDKYDYFADQEKMLPATDTRKLSDSLVYMNGHLLCEYRQLITTAVGMSDGANHQVLLYPESKTARVYDAGKKEWGAPDNKTYEDVMTFADAYRNSLRAVQYNIPVAIDDRMQIYAFSFANDYTNTITIDTVHTPLLTTYIGDKDSQTPSDSVFFSGDYADEKIVTIINGEPVSYQQKERVEDEQAGVGVKLTYGTPQLGPVRIIIYPQRVRIKYEDAFPFECYEVYLNGIRQYGHEVDPLVSEDSRAKWDGDAPEIAPNGRHYYEEDILTLTSGANNQLTRAEAIALLALDPKYRDSNTQTEYINQSYYIERTEDGSFICFDVPVCGAVTYVVHPPESGHANIGHQYFMDYNNAVPGTENVYRLSEHESFYPGRVVVYVNGVRQPQDSYSLIDNRTIIFIDKDNRVLGDEKNFRKEIVKDEAGNEYPEHAEYRLDDDNNLIRLPHKESDKIMVEVRDDYGWQEAHIRLKRTKDCFKIALNQYNLIPSILESGDEIKIYIDGTFMGLKRDVGYRRVTDTLNPTLEIIDADAIERLTSDPMTVFLDSNPEAKLIYQNEHGGKDYVPPQKDIILEWR